MGKLLLSLNGLTMTNPLLSLLIPDRLPASHSAPIPEPMEPTRELCVTARDRGSEEVVRGGESLALSPPPQTMNISPSLGPLMQAAGKRDWRWGSGMHMGNPH
jgi:hypothetical protein